MTVDIHFSPTWWVIDHNYDVDDIINCWLAILPHSCNRFYAKFEPNQTQWAKTKRSNISWTSSVGCIVANACLCNWAKWTAQKKLQQLKSATLRFYLRCGSISPRNVHRPASSMLMFNLYVKYQSLFAMTNGFCAEWFWWMVAAEQRLNLIEYNNKCFFCFPTKRNRLSCTVKLIEHIWLFW